MFDSSVFNVKVGTRAQIHLFLQLLGREVAGVLQGMTKSLDTILIVKKPLQVV